MNQHRWSSRYAGSALMIALVAAAALAAFLPVGHLTFFPTLVSRLRLPPVSIPRFGISWTDLATTPTAVHRAALATFFNALLWMTAGVLVVAGLTVIAIGVVRGSARVTEMTIRRAVGASRRRLLGSVLVEGVIMVVAALVLGGVVGWPLARAFQSLWPGLIEYRGLNVVLAGVVGIAGPVLVSALLPMISMRRRVLTVPTGRPLELLVAGFQFGISLTVLGATTLLSRETARLNDAAARGNGRVYQFAALGAPAQRSISYARLIRRLESTSDVDVSLTSFGAPLGLGMRDLATTDCGRCIQGMFAVPLKPVLVAFHAVSADTFRTMGIDLVAGRGIRDSDTWDAPRIAVISRSLAHDHYERQGAVGRGIQIGLGFSNWYKVVGVVDDLEPSGFGAALGPRYGVYLSALQHPPEAAQLLVRTAQGARPPDVATLLRDVPGIANPTSTDEVALMRGETAPIRWFRDVIGVEGWVMLVLAAAGVFALMHLWVLSVRQEIGVRRAVGASRVRILAFVVSRSLGVVAGGVIFAGWLGIMAWGTLTTAISGLPEWDAPVLLGYVPLLGIAALAGAAAPVLRILRATPAEVFAREH